MRVKRLSAVFLLSCIFVVVFVLYVVMDMSTNLPKIYSPVEEVDDRWTSFENKLKVIENELNKHSIVVGEIRSAVNTMSQKKGEMSQTKQNSQNKKIVSQIKKPDTKPVIREGKDYGLPAKAYLNQTTCPIMMKYVPSTDVQMLSLYDRIMFDDKDGGVWKQGWKITYDEQQWSKKKKLKVFIVPHSHNDPGWLKTFEKYYQTQTRAIFENMISKMSDDTNMKLNPKNNPMKFIWAEISFLSLWWNLDAKQEDKEKFKKLVNMGNIEIVTGGWVMNDEANSHWISIIQQLTAGHQWLIDNLGIIPQNAWSIDPFGYSSAMPYLLKLAGLRNSVIQRVHYRVKKELAGNKQLEFQWRQLWDGVGKSDMLTHMMPFYSYDAPHSCGPDPKICCQFDFKRLPGNGVSCPWGTPPVKIIPKNIEERSYTILDQWRKKAQLYQSNSVLIPLGDDFRYDRANEWNNQFENYQLLIDYINNKEEWNAEVQFATLEDYFSSVHSELSAEDFPVLSGDFFTYADRNEHYWSGYYTSRPFYKNMDRVLLAYLRSSEILTSAAILSGSVSKILAIQLVDRVDEARRALALFQHHDGVTGTSRDDVKVDYAKKMLKAIKYCQSAIQQSSYYLLEKPQIKDQIQEDIFFDVDDVWRTHDEVPSKIHITLDVLVPSRKIVFYNSLTFARKEVVTLFVNSPHVEVFDPEGNPMLSQISPTITGETRMSFATNKFQLSFLVDMKPLSLTVYTVSLRDSLSLNKYTSFARVRVYNANMWSVNLPAVFEINSEKNTLNEDITLQAGNSTKVVANKNGLIKTVVSNEGVVVPVHMDYVQYGSKKDRDNNSGAYLFLPDGPAVPLKTNAYPEIVLTEGPFKATLYTHLKSEAQIMLAISVYNNPSLPQSEVEISNTFLIDPLAEDFELAMRFSTAIKNGDTFYTDLNGMQMIKRRYFDKLPLQANFYPMPAATYIQDEATRLTLLTSTPLGMAALQPGQIEVMQDRRLSRDDNRGLNQGVLDNIRTRHTFKLILESATSCKTKPAPDHPSGQLSIGAHISQQSLLNPIVVMHFTAKDEYEMPSYSALKHSYGVDVVLAAFTSHVSGRSASSRMGNILHGSGLTFQRVDLTQCYGDPRVVQFYPLGDGQVNLSDLTGVTNNNLFNSSLTFNSIGKRIKSEILDICPMEIRSVFIHNVDATQ